MSDAEASSSHNNNTSTSEPSIIRDYQYWLYFFTLLIVSGGYTCLSVTILPMTGVNLPNETEAGTPVLTNPGTVLSACFWAHFIPHIFGSKLTQIMNPKWIILFSIFIQSVFNIMIPSMAFNFGSTGVIICRVFQGLCQGFLFASFTSLINLRAPPSKKNMMFSIVFTGCTLGTTVGFPLAGVLALTEPGWPLVFYVYGSTGLLWGIIYAYFGESKIPIQAVVNTSTNRIETVQDNRENEIINSNEIHEEALENIVALPTPWGSIVLSKPVWAILFSSAAHSWGSSILLTHITIYINNILKLGLAKDGFLSGIPYIFQVILNTAILFTYKLIDKNITNIGNKRKLYNSLGLYLPASAFMALAFIDQTAKEAAVVFLIIAVSCTAFTSYGYLLNVLDIAPNHTPILFTLVNTVGSIFESLGPLTVGFYGNEKNNAILWRYVFTITTILYLVAGIIYCIFASADIQRWNSEAEEFKLLRQITNFFRRHYITIKNRIIRFFGCDSFSCSFFTDYFSCSLCKRM